MSCDDREKVVRALREMQADLTRWADNRRKAGAFFIYNDIEKYFSKKRAERAGFKAAIEAARIFKFHEAVFRDFIVMLERLEKRMLDGEFEGPAGEGGGADEVDRYDPVAERRKREAFDAASSACSCGWNGRGAGGAVTKPGAAVSGPSAKEGEVAP
jgi:hypothetical protein